MKFFEKTVKTVSAFSSFIIAIFTIVLVFVTKCYVDKTNTIIKISKDQIISNWASSGIAAEMLELTKSQIRQQNRPFLHIEDGQLFIGPNKIQVQIQLSNYGRTPARSIFFKIEIARPPVINGRRIPYTSPRIFSGSPRFPIMPGETITHTFAIDKPIERYLVRFDPQSYDVILDSTYYGNIRNYFSFLNKATDIRLLVLYEGSLDDPHDHSLEDYRSYAIFRFDNSRKKWYISSKDI